MVFDRVRLRALAAPAAPPVWARLLWYDEPAACVVELSGALLRIPDPPRADLARGSGRAGCRRFYAAGLRLLHPLAAARCRNDPMASPAVAAPTAGAQPQTCTPPPPSAPNRTWRSPARTGSRRRHSPLGLQPQPRKTRPRCRPSPNAPSAKTTNVGVGGAACAAPGADGWGSTAPHRSRPSPGKTNRRAQRRGRRHGAMLRLPGAHRQPGRAGRGLARRRQANL